jgi:hypothetical protein
VTDKESASSKPDGRLQYWPAAFCCRPATRVRCSHYLPRLLASVVISLIVAWGATSHVLAQEIERRIASGGLNEFDLALWCGDWSAAPGSDSRFGFATLSTGQAPEFVYIASRSYVQLGPHGDPGDCKFKRYLYRLDKAGLFKREEIGEQRFVKIERDLQSFEQSFERSNPGKELYPALRSPADVGSVGGCLFPISWQKIGGQSYALLSIAALGGIVNYVVPHYADRSSDCNAWGDRRLANSSIVSAGIDFLSIDIGHDLFFVESQQFRMGFLFKPNLDFQCLTGDDEFSDHILISRWTFDTEVRPALNDLIGKHAAKWQLSQSSTDPDVLSFSDSAFLNHEFATFVKDLAKKKGCK